MKNMWKILAVAMLGGFACAEETVPAEAAEALNQDQLVEVTVSGQMQKVFDEFAEKRNITYGQPLADGTYYQTAYDIVGKGPESPDFIKLRQIAFERAFNKAVAEFIRYQTGVQAVETVSEMFQDESSALQDPPASFGEAEAVLKKKIGALAEAKLDTELQKLGVDPAKYARKPLEVKRILYSSTLLNTSVIRGARKMTGLSVVKTFEARTEKGTFGIGVIVKYAPQTERIAECMARKQRPVMAPKAGIKVSQLLGGDPARMVQNFGVRCFYDEDGAPALISFAQWATTYQGKDERRLERSRENALKQAEDAANKSMTDYITGNASIEEFSQRGASETQANVFAEDGSFREEDTAGVIDQMRTKFRSTGSDTLKGRRTVLKKLVKHPETGHDVAIAAVCWSYKQLELMTPGTAPVRGVVAPEPKKVKPGVSEGDEYDF